MLFKLINVTGRALIRRTFIREASTASQWDLLTGVCVERSPVVTAPLNDLQVKYKELINTLEFEKSLKSDHELRQESDRATAELIKIDASDANLDAMSKNSAQDFEDTCNEEFTKLKLAEIETEADKKNDKTSLDRSLQRHLILVTKHKLGNDVKMLLPQGVRNEGETLRQTAERVLADHCGSSLEVQFLGNAPCGFYKYKYPSEINGKVGAKIFFYYAKHKGGNVDSNTKFEWLTRKEMDSSLPASYKQSVSEFLVTETY